MALQQINGNQISDLTDATITSLRFKNTNSVLQLPSGTTAQRPTGVAYGTTRFNTTEDKVEVYVTNFDGQGTDGWTLVGAGGPHVGTKDTSYIRTNSPIIDENVTIGPVANGGAQFTNAFAVGPVEIASGYTLTIENGAVFYIAGDDEGSTTTIDNVVVYQTLNASAARLDIGPTREIIVPYRFGTGDTMLPIDYKLGNIYWLTNMTNNFSINIINLPTTAIGAGGADTNKAFGFTLVLEQGNPAFRPNGTIMVDGSSIGSIQWSGGNPPSTINANRRAVFGLTVTRTTTNNGSGGTNTNWWSFGQFTEFA
jgi:hypothetical protein